MNDSQDPKDHQPQQLVTAYPYAKLAQQGSEQAGELGEILHKVLPAGGPLSGQTFPTWKCDRCHLLSPVDRRDTCMSGCTSGCPMVAA